MPFYVEVSTGRVIARNILDQPPPRDRYALIPFAVVTRLGIQDGRVLSAAEMESISIPDNHLAVPDGTVSEDVSGNSRQTAANPGWYPDPAGVYAFRYFNRSGQWERNCRTSDGTQVVDTATQLADLNISPVGVVEPRHDQPSAPPPETYTPGTTITGQNGVILIRTHLIEITRTSLTGDLLLGNLRGTKTIPLRAVQAVQFKRATRTVGGALELVVAGDNSNTGQNTFRTGNAVSDAMFGRRLARSASENIVTFTLTQQPPFLGLHRYLLDAIAAGGVNPASASPAPPHTQPAFTHVDGLVAQLERLQALRQAGALTDDEFSLAKARLLSGDH